MIKRLSQALATVLVLCSAAAEARTLGTPVPAQATGGVVGDVYTFSWSRVHGATYYQIWATDATGAARDQWVTSAASGCGSEEPMCSATLEWPLATGKAMWWVRAWMPNESGPWSAGRELRIIGRVPNTIFADRNVAFGTQAMGKRTSFSDSWGSNHSEDNTAVGYSALYNLTGATWSYDGNTAVGSRALFNLKESYDGAELNTAVGASALVGLASGRQNLAVGFMAGSGLGSGNANAYFYNHGPALFPTTASESNTMRLGHSVHTHRTFISGIFNVTSPSGASVYVNSQGQLGTATSSRRYKQNIRSLDFDSKRVYSLKPVAFEYNPAIDPDAILQFGLIAEEVEKVFPELIIRNTDGTPETVRYQLLVPLLLNEVQKHQQTTSVQAKQLAAQAKRIASQEEQLKALSAKVEALLKARQ